MTVINAVFKTSTTVPLHFSMLVYLAKQRIYFLVKYKFLSLNVVIIKLMMAFNNENNRAISFIRAPMPNSAFQLNALIIFLKHFVCVFIFLPMASAVHDSVGQIYVMWGINGRVTVFATI